MLIISLLLIARNLIAIVCTQNICILEFGSDFSRPLNQGGNFPSTLRWEIVRQAFRSEVNKYFENFLINSLENFKNLEKNCNFSL